MSFNKVIALIVAGVVAALAVCLVLLVKADNDCKASGGHTVTETTYGYRYTPGTTTWEFGPIHTSSCQH